MSLSPATFTERRAAPDCDAHARATHQAQWHDVDFAAQPSTAGPSSPPHERFPTSMIAGSAAPTAILKGWLEQPFGFGFPMEVRWFGLNERQTPGPNGAESGGRSCLMSIFTARLYGRSPAGQFVVLDGGQKLSDRLMCCALCHLRGRAMGYRLFENNSTPFNLRRSQAASAA